MDAKAKTVNEILYASTQYVIPFFQRQYSWTQKHWRRLWNDLETLLTDGATSKHFLGPMVCTSIPGVPGEVPQFLLIDGQQRMTTLALLLAALRDVGQKNGDQDLAAEITEGFLTHKHKKGMQRYKVIPRIADRDALIGIVEGKSKKPSKSTIPDAAKFFRRQIERYMGNSGPGALRPILTAATDRLSLVAITIDGENPYEIFESLNSTGLPLEESDLIRNYIFMKVPTGQQEVFWDEHWGPLEEMFGEEGDRRAATLTQFYRAYLMRDGKYSKKRNTFVDFKSQNSERKLSPEDQADELRRFAQYDAWLRNPSHCADTALGKRLAEIAMLDVTTCHPLLMHLLDMHESGALGADALYACIDDLCSFVLRRAMCLETTRPYSRWFPDAIREIKDDPRADLRSYWLGRGWPDDAALAAALAAFPVYRREQRKAKLMLTRIEESYRHKEQADLASLTIEHVMPQTLSGAKGKAWKAMLGDEWKNVHARLLHTLGNLTLTGYNADMSNRPFPEKRESFAESNVKMNRRIAAEATWNAVTIHARGKRLAAKVTSLWARPEGPAYVPGRQSRSGRLSADQRRAYWEEFLGTDDWQGFARTPKATSRGHLSFRLPKLRQFRLVTYMVGGKRIGVMVSCRGAKADANWEKLRDSQAELEREMGCELIWEQKQGATRLISTSRPADLSDPGAREQQHAWLRETLLKAKEVFLPRLEPLASKGGGGMRQLRLDYWTALHDRLIARKSVVKPHKPNTDYWTSFALGRSRFWLWAKISARDRYVALAVGFCGKKAKDHFRELKEDKQAIESEIGCPLDWQLRPDKKESHVILELPDSDPTNRDDWDRQQTWLVEKLEAFHNAFSPRVKALRKGRSG